jgi:hypothetical protein
MKAVATEKSEQTNAEHHRSVGLQMFCEERAVFICSEIVCKMAASSKIPVLVLTINSTVQLRWEAELSAPLLRTTEDSSKRIPLPKSRPKKECQNQNFLNIDLYSDMRLRAYLCLILFTHE